MNDIIPQRQCSKCKQEFPATTEYFYKDAKSKYGLSCQCKTCAKQKAKDWHWSHREYANEVSRKRYQSRPEEYAARSKADREARPEVYREYHANYYQEHKAEVLAQNKEWAINNPDKVQAIQKRYRDKNARKCVLATLATRQRYPDRYKALARESRLRNPATSRRARHERRAREHNAEGTYTNADIINIFDDQNGRCYFCGITLFMSIPGDYHIDHLIALNQGGSNWPDNLVLSCGHCNCSRQDRSLEEWTAVRGW